MAMTTRFALVALLLFNFLARAATPARAELFSLASSGTISANTSGDATIPIGTPWAFELTYDTDRARPRLRIDDVARSDIRTIQKFRCATCTDLLPLSSGDLRGHAG